MSRLLPNEKHRQKKDFGTTSYKKPGPPTPSKNGGRLSLQGNEIQPLREQNQRMTITPKKVTPSRIKALFMGRTNVARENTEVDIDYIIDMIDQYHNLSHKNLRNDNCCLFCSFFVSDYVISRLYNIFTRNRHVNPCYLQALLLGKISLFSKNFFTYIFFLMWRSDSISTLFALGNVSKT